MQESLNRLLRRRMNALLYEIMDCEEPVFSFAQCELLENRFLDIQEDMADAISIDFKS